MEMARCNRRLFAIAVLCCASLAGCSGGGPSDPVPTRPAYVPDIQRITYNHCAVCHTVPPQHGAPDFYDFTQYDDDSAGKQGVFNAGCIIKQRAVNGNPSFMPPAGQVPLTPDERETIARWAEDGRIRLVGDTAAGPVCP